MGGGRNFKNRKGYVTKKKNHKKSPVCERCKRREEEVEKQGQIVQITKRKRGQVKCTPMFDK